MDKTLETYYFHLVTRKMNDITPQCGGQLAAPIRQPAENLLTRSVTDTKPSLERGSGTNVVDRVIWEKKKVLNDRK